MEEEALLMTRKLEIKEPMQRLYKLFVGGMRDRLTLGIID